MSDNLTVKIINEAQALSAGIDPAIFRGSNAYLHIRFAPVSNPTDDQVSVTPNEFIGLCASHQAEAPGDAASYTWIRINYQSAETARVQAEQERAAAEQGRSQTERERVSAEAGRGQAEQQRATAEQSRASAEAARAKAEADRASAELGRAGAEGDRVTAELGRVSAEGSRVTAEQARETAKEAMAQATAAIQGMTIAAQTLAPSSQATAAISEVEGHKHIALGLPEGKQGRSVVSIARTAGTGAAGTVDTYTITYSDNTTSIFEVRNGANGAGAGDMEASTYDPNGDGKVERADHADSAGALDAESAIAQGQVTGLGAALAEKAGASDLAAHTENKSNPHGVTAAQAGARPASWTPTAQEVGARPDNWTPTAAQVGAESIGAVAEHNTAADAHAERFGAKADKPVIKTATLTASGWSGSAAPYTQTLSVAGVPADQAAVVMVGYPPSATKEQMEAWAAGMVLGTAHAAGSITFQAKGDKPEISLPVQIVIQG